MRVFLLSLAVVARASDDQSLLQQGVAMSTGAAAKAAMVAKFSAVVDALASPLAKSSAAMARSFVQSAPLNQSTKDDINNTWITTIEEIEAQMLASRDNVNDELVRLANLHNNCPNLTQNDTFNDHMAQTVWGHGEAHAACRLEEKGAHDHLMGNDGCGHINSWYQLLESTNHFPECNSDHGVTFDAYVEIEDGGVLEHVLEAQAGYFATQKNMIEPYKEGCIQARNDFESKQEECDGLQGVFSSAYCSGYSMREQQCDDRAQCYTDKATDYNNEVTLVEPDCTKRIDEIASLRLIICMLEKLRDWDGEGEIDGDDECMTNFQGRGDSFNWVDCTYPGLGDEHDCARIGNNPSDHDFDHKCDAVASDGCTSWADCPAAR